MYSVLNNSENALLLRTLTARARSETWSHNMRTAAYCAAGVGVLFICGSVALVLYANGTALADDWMAHAGESFGHAFSAVVGNIPVHGTVTMDPGKVTGEVKVGQDKPLQVAGEVTVNIPRPTDSQLGLTGRPPSNTKVVTNFTVFKTVEMPPGQVVTGWAFETSNDEQPSKQYCYYMQKIDESTQAKIDIGDNGTFIPPKRAPKSLDVVTAFQNCIWK